MRKLLIVAIILLFITPESIAQKTKMPNYQILPFGERGQIGMLYVRQQRPQAVSINNKNHIGFNAGSEKRPIGESEIKPMIVTYNQETKAFLGLDGSSNTGRVILEESFNYHDGKLPSMWWSEGNLAQIKDGHLFVDADTDAFRVSTIWLDRKLSGNIKNEFDVHIVSSSDTANNINCFFLYSDPYGKSLRDTKHQREDAAYSEYHKLNGYIITYLGGGNPTNARFRFRDNPGFNLISENFGYENKIGETYHIKIIKKGDRIQYWVDGRIFINSVDDQYNLLHKEGLFGFRTYHTALWWDNLMITQLDQK